MCLCALLGIALYNVLLNTGQRSVPPGAASFIIATQPIFAAALSATLGHERLTLATLSGSAVSLLGVAIISLGQFGSWRMGHGAVFVVAAAACSGSYFVLQRPLVQRYGAIASKLRRWYVARRLGEAALAYYQNARARLTLEYLPRTYPR